MKRLSIALVAVFILAVGVGVVFSDEHKSSKKSISSELAAKHPDNWADEDIHGGYVEKYGDSKCQECHGSDLKGLNEAPSCQECHDKHEEND